MANVVLTVTRPFRGSPQPTARDSLANITATSNPVIRPVGRDGNGQLMLTSCVRDTAVGAAVLVVDGTTMTAGDDDDDDDDGDDDNDDEGDDDGEDDDDDDDDDGDDGDDDISRRRRNDKGYLSAMTAAAAAVAGANGDCWKILLDMTGVPVLVSAVRE